MHSNKLKGVTCDLVLAVVIWVVFYWPKPAFVREILTTKTSGSANPRFVLVIHPSHDVELFEAREQSSPLGLIDDFGCCRKCVGPGKSGLDGQIDLDAGLTLPWALSRQRLKNQAHTENLFDQGCRAPRIRYVELPIRRWSWAKSWHYSRPFEIERPHDDSRSLTLDKRVSLGPDLPVQQIGLPADSSQGSPSQKRCSSADYNKCPVGPGIWPERLFPFARLILGALCLLVPIVLLDDRGWQTWAAALLFLLGFILLCSPLPWDLRSYVPGCYQQTQYGPSYRHDGGTVAQSRETL